MRFLAMAGLWSRWWGGLILGLSVFAAEPLTTLRAVQSLKNSQADQALPVVVRAVVTVYQPASFSWFIQEDGVGTYVVCDPARTKDWPLEIGDLIEMRGTTERGGYSPNIRPVAVKVLGKAQLPAPVDVKRSDLDEVRQRNTRVRAQGTLISIRAGRKVPNFSHRDSVVLEIDGRITKGYLPPGSIPQLSVRPGALVEVTGIETVEYTPQQRLLGGSILLTRVEDLRVLQEPPARDDQSLPLSPIPGLLRLHGTGRIGEVVRVRGVVTFSDQERLFLQEEESGIEVDAALGESFQPGDWLEAVGHLAWGRDQDLILLHGKAVKLGTRSPPSAIRLRAADSADWPFAGSLVEVEGEIFHQYFTEAASVLEMRTPMVGGVLGFAPKIDIVVPSSTARKLSLQLGDTLRARGVYDVQLHSGRAQLGDRRILVRSPADLDITRRPPWWDRVPWATVAAALFGAAGLGIIMLTSLRRQVAEKTLALRRQSEELRSAMAAAQRANEAKSDFLANMSHEIRTPMNGVLGMIGLAMEGPLEPRQREDLTWARRSAESLLKLLNDILDLSKIEAGRLSIESIAFDLSSVLDDVLHINGNAASEKGLSLLLGQPEPRHRLVMGDPARLRQILLNLVSNAIKFTDAGSVTLTVRSQAEYFEFEVRDTGIGIPVEKRALVFRKFEQADATVTRRFGGTGLGLAISQQLAQMMGGDIRVESNQPHGSVFILRLPLPPAVGAASSAAAAAIPSVSPGVSLRVLVAEDNIVNQRLIVRLLEKDGHEVVLASNGQEAVDRYFSSGPFDVILMDMQMPGVSGWEATAEIRRRESPPAVRIIALTAHAMAGDREQCLAAGMNDYLTKPVRESELRTALQPVM